MLVSKPSFIVFVTFALVYSTSAHVICDVTKDSEEVFIVDFMRDGDPLIEFDAHAASCDDIILHPDGILFSPNYPSYYPNDLECSWTVQGEYGRRIYLETHIYSIAPSDSLKIYDGVAPNSNKIMLNITDDQNQSYERHSTSNSVLITFTTDSICPGDGFSIDYKHFDNITSSQPICNGVELYPDGDIKSPNYPFEYQNDLDCSWTIHGDYGRQIYLYVYVDELRRGDFLKIYDSSNENDSAVIANRTDLYHTSMHLYSKTNIVYIVFKTDCSSTGDGFIIYYRHHDTTTTSPPEQTTTTISSFDDSHNPTDMV